MNTWAEASFFFRAPKELVGRNFVVPPTRACCALPASCPGVGGGSHSNWPQTLLGTLGLALSGDVISCVLTVHCLPVAQVLGGFAFLALSGHELPAAAASCHPGKYWCGDVTAAGPASAANYAGQAAPCGAGSLRSRLLPRHSCQVASRLRLLPLGAEGPEPGGPGGIASFTCRRACQTGNLEKTSPSGA